MVLSGMTEQSYKEGHPLFIVALSLAWQPAVREKMKKGVEY